MIFNLFTKTNGTWKADTLSGLTVALALVPEAIAFSFVAKVDPIVGLWSAVFLGLITSAFGGRPGMISGATGAIAVVVAKSVEMGNVAGAELELSDQFVDDVIVELLSVWRDIAAFLAIKI